MKRRTTVASQRLRLSWSSQPSLALIVLVAIALVLQLSDENILPVANGQRAIASLGTKLKKQLQATRSGDGRRRRSSDNDDIENDQMVQTAMLGGNNDGKVDLSFEGIQLELKTKKNGIRQILDGSIKGKVESGQLLAIMGPSGSGKSSILHALAGRIKENSKLSLKGKRYLNDGNLVASDSLLPSCAFVSQETSANFFPYMTVYETLYFRLELKLGSKIKSRKVKDQIIQNILQQVNLEEVQNTIVGNSKIRGISGGERRRLAIACELITDDEGESGSPSIILLGA